MSAPKGSLKPPNSGRAKGQPNHATADIKALAQEWGEWAILQLVALAAGAPESAARVAALRELLNRGYGLPKQHVTVDGEVQVTSVRRSVVDPVKPMTRAADVTDAQIVH